MRYGLQHNVTHLAGVAALMLGFGAQAAAAQEDAVAFATRIAEQGQNSVMSKDKLGEGAVVWTGAETAPKPAAGAVIAVMPCPLALEVCQKNLKYATEAAEAIGWEVVPIDTKGDPATAQRGVDAALNRGVQCVLMLGAPARDIRAQIQRGKEKGVAFVTGFADDPREFGGDIGFGIDQAAAGKLLAAHVIANGGGKVVIFTAPAFPQLAVRLQGFKDYLAEHGGGVAEVLEEIEFNVGAGAPDLVTKTQALLTRYPRDSFTWVLGPYDESLVPVLSTAKQRERGEIRGLSFDGEPVALKSIADGGPQSATVAWGLEWVAWAGVDECNRAMNGAEVGVNTDFPIQLVTAANLPADGRYDPGFDFRARYKAMWDAAK
jgi:ribose transport system substrate-binding protein